MPEDSRDRGKIAQEPNNKRIGIEIQRKFIEIFEDFKVGALKNKAIHRIKEKAKQKMIVSYEIL